MNEENQNSTNTSNEDKKEEVKVEQETSTVVDSKTEVKKEDSKVEETKNEKKDEPVKVEAKKEEPKSAPQPQPEPAKASTSNNYTQTVNEPVKKKKSGFKISFIFILLVVIAGAIGGAVYATMFAKTEIDLAKYVSIEFEGYEGTASFDTDDLVFDTKGLKKALNNKSLATKLEKKLSSKATMKNSEKLKNGDKIEIKFKVSESWLQENKIKLASDTINLTVKDLEEPDSIDLFEDLEFKYSGVSPNLTLSFDNKSSDSFIKSNVSYTIEKEGDYPTSYSLYDVANGDEITVKATYSEDDLASSGYIIDEDEYTFTVSDQAAYIIDSKDLSEDIQKAVKAKFEEKVKTAADSINYEVASAYHEDFADISNYSYSFTHSDPTLEKIYIAINNKKENAGWLDAKNIVFAIYKVTFTEKTTSKTYNYYIPVYVEDLVVKDKKLDSSQTYYYDKYYSWSDEYTNHKTVDDVYKLFEKEKKDNYTITEVK